jgi:hypothetical protein
MRTPRTWTVVGQLCRTEAQAKEKLLALRKWPFENPSTSQNDWGLLKIRTGKGDSPFVVGKIHLPLPPALLTRLEGLLSGSEVRRTAEGRKALQLVRTALKRR